MAKILGITRRGLRAFGGFGKAPEGSAARVAADYMWEFLDAQIDADLTFGTIQEGYASTLARYTKSKPATGLCPRGGVGERNTCAVILARGPSAWRDELRYVQLPRLIGGQPTDAQRRQQAYALITDLAERLTTEIDATVPWADELKADADAALQATGIKFIGKPLPLYVLPPSTPTPRSGEAAPPSPAGEGISTTVLVVGGLVVLGIAGGIMLYARGAKPATLTPNRGRRR